MNSKIILILAATLFWSSGSWWWYTCKIKGLCSSEQTLASNDTHTVSPDTPPDMLATNLTKSTTNKASNLSPNINTATPSVFNHQAEAIPSVFNAPIDEVQLEAQKPTSDIYIKPIDSKTLAATNIEQLTYDLFNSPLNKQSNDQPSAPIDIASTDNTEERVSPEPTTPEAIADNQQANVKQTVDPPSKTAEAAHQPETNNIVAITVDLTEPEKTSEKEPEKVTDIPNKAANHNTVENNSGSNSHAPQISLASMRSSTEVLRNTLDRERTRKPPKRIISFSSNSAKFNKNRANQAYLNQLTDWLLHDMSNNVTIIGYTDNKGEQANNVLLGLIRASNVKKELIRLGAPQYSVRIESQGNLKPIASNDTVIGRKQNRRVEIIPSTF